MASNTKVFHNISKSKTYVEIEFIGSGEFSNVFHVKEEKTQEE